MAKKRSTADFYKKNPEAYAKKLAYDKKRNAKPERKEYRAELARERRARGIMGKGGPDVSHQAGGGFKLENARRNRARNGSGGKPKLANGSGTRKSSTKYNPRKKK